MFVLAALGELDKFATFPGIRSRRDFLEDPATRHERLVGQQSICKPSRPDVAARYLRSDVDQGPPLHGRRMSPSSTHSDLVIGAKRAVVVSLTDGEPGSGPRFSSMPNTIRQEIKTLEAAGTRTMLIAANPGKVDLVLPEEIKPAMQLGYDRGVREAGNIKAFWA